MILCAGNGESFDFATPIGVGLIESAINLTKTILYTQPEFLLFIGSAGSYGNHKIFDIVESTTATNIELSMIANTSYTPIDNVIEASNIGFVSRGTKVNSSNYITTTTQYNDFFNTQEIGVENMEFYAVLRVAKEFNIPAGGAFVVTNYCGENAHEEFVANHNQAMRMLVEHLQKRKLIQ